MELDNNTKREIVKGLIGQIQQSAYTNEVMGKTWQKLGNTEAAKMCAEKLAENTKAIAELNAELEGIA